MSCNFLRRKLANQAPKKISSRGNAKQNRFESFTSTKARDGSLQFQKPQDACSASLCLFWSSRAFGYASQVACSRSKVREPCSFFGTGGDAMCAENAQVILHCLKVSHRPGKENRTQPSNQTTKNKTNKQNQQTTCQDTTQAGHAEVKQDERGETRGVKLSKTASQCKLRMSRQFKGQAAVLRSVALEARGVNGPCISLS